MPGWSIGFTGTGTIRMRLSGRRPGGFGQARQPCPANRTIRKGDRGSGVRAIRGRRRTARRRAGRPRRSGNVPGGAHPPGTDLPVADQVVDRRDGQVQALGGLGHGIRRAVDAQPSGFGLPHEWRALRSERQPLVRRSTMAANRKDIHRRVQGRGRPAGDRGEQEPRRGRPRTRPGREPTAGLEAGPGHQGGSGLPRQGESAARRGGTASPAGREPAAAGRPGDFQYCTLPELTIVRRLRS